MIDKTTEGYSATTEEIEGMLRNLCAYALSDPEPLQRYIDLTHQQVLFEGVVAAIRRERGKALGDLAAMGVPLGKVAELAKLELPQHVKVADDRSRRPDPEAAEGARVQGTAGIPTCVAGGRARAGRGTDAAGHDRPGRQAHAHAARAASARPTGSGSDHTQAVDGRVTAR